ncbi:hypothetical protein M5E87_26265 [Flavonifractor plautii]|nr:hypothetical protein M5E87_26265 [Flavonifractor plautii]
MSDHIAVLYLGEVIEYSTSEELYHNPRHPYTKELLRSIPQISGDARLSTANREPPIELPSPIRPPSGCRYHPAARTGRRTAPSIFRRLPWWDGTTS